MINFIPVLALYHTLVAGDLMKWGKDCIYSSSKTITIFICLRFNTTVKRSYLYLSSFNNIAYTSCLKPYEMAAIEWVVMKNAMSTRFPLKHTCRCLTHYLTILTWQYFGISNYFFQYVNVFLVKCQTGIINTILFSTISYNLVTKYYLWK